MPDDDDQRELQDRLRHEAREHRGPSAGEGDEGIRPRRLAVGRRRGGGVCSRRHPAQLARRRIRAVWKMEMPPPRKISSSAVASLNLASAAWEIGRRWSNAPG